MGPQMIGRTVVMVEVLNLSTPSQLAEALVDARKYFNEFRLPQPPIPRNFSALLPCDLLITETHGEDGSRTGRIKFTDPTGQVLYVREWAIAPATRPPA